MLLPAWVVSASMQGCAAFVMHTCLQEANTAGAPPQNYSPPADVGAALKKGATKMDLPDPLKTVLPTKVTMLGGLY